MKKLYWLCLFVILSRALSAQSPVAINDTATILQLGTATINALANDTNHHAGDTLCITSIWGVPATWAVLPTCSTIVYHALDSGFTGRDTFYYQVCDRHIPTLCDTGRVIITIRHLLPIAHDDTVSVTQFDTITIRPLANDSNYHPGDSLCLSTIWSQNIGWGTISGCRQITYHAVDSSFFGYDSLYYKVCDVVATTLCDTGLIVVHVKRVIPIALNDSVSISQPGSITINVLFNDTNFRAGDALCITSIWDTTRGWEVVSGCSNINYHPLDPNFEGVDTFYYSACDQHAANLCDTGMVLVYVFPLRTMAHIGHLDSMCSVTLINQSTHDDLVTWELKGANSGADVIFNYVDTIVLDWTTGFVPDVYSVCLTSSNATNTSSVCDTVSYGCLGIHQIASTDLRIYPNPATDVVRIDLSRIDPATLTSLSMIEVYDMIGTRLKSIPVSTYTSIPVSDLSNGVYLIGLTDHSSAKSVLGKFEVVR